jgi:hypothetical protein
LRNLPCFFPAPSPATNAPTLPSNAACSIMPNKVHQLYVPGPDGFDECRSEPVCTDISK